MPHPIILASPRLPGVGPGGVVDKGVLEQREEDERDADVVPHVYRLSWTNLHLIGSPAELLHPLG